MSSNGTTLRAWQEMPLRELICGKLQNGAFVQKPEKGRGLLFANVVNMYGGIHLDYDTLERLSLDESEIERYKLNEGDVLVVRSSLKRDGIGQSCIARYLTETVFYDCHLIRVVPDQSKILPEFLSFYWRSPVGKQDLINRSKTTTMTTINQAGLSGAIVPLPPLPEQKKIAHILSTVQRAIEAQERIIRTTTELKKALMHKLFTEGLRNEPQKQTEIGPVPQSWEVVELGSLAKVGNGSTPKRAKETYWDGGTIPWLNSTKIHDRFITEAEQFVTPQAVKECHLPKVAPNSLLIAITGQGKTLGNSAITRIETCINQHLAYAQFHSEKIIPDFVLWFMQTRYDMLRSIAHGRGSTKGALTCGFLKTVGIPVPSTGEQSEIISIFRTIDEKQALAASKRTALQDLFRTLLHDLMTAKTRVHNVALHM